MDIKNIKKIIDLMKANELSEFEMEEEGFRIAIKQRNGEPQVVLSQAGATPVVLASTPASAGSAAAPAPASAAESAAPAEPAVEEKFAEIKSPIVGTFYRAASPDAESYVTVGQEVEPETVVCIIEAMKVMNEIKAQVKGVIRKILVDNATPVQFGQALFQVDPK